MIARLTGNIIEKNVKSLILDVNGVGYQVFTTSGVLRHVKEGGQTAFYIHHVVREDASDLYGFVKEEDLALFTLLITVSGVGPKSALSVLSNAGGDTVRRAVASGDSTYLTKISGIGRKTAEKIVLELREKIGEFGEKENSDFQGEIDAIEALRTLGYSMEDARDAIKKVDKQIVGAGERVKSALKLLGTKK